MDTQTPPSAVAEQEKREFSALKWVAGGVVLVVIASSLIIGNKVKHDVRDESSPAASASTPGATSSAAAVSASTAPASLPSSSTTAPVAATGTGDAAATKAIPAGFRPAAQDKIPEGPFGDVIRKGEQIFLHTGTNAKPFVGNTLNCVNCHLDAGRLKDSAPLWGAYGMYPAYRAKTKSVSTFSERLRGCFMYSMNGKAPPDGHEVLVALETYAYWMAKGAPTGEKSPGAGFAKLDKPAQTADYQRGKAIFEAQCVLCHGANGEGQRSGDTQVFPPLWGSQSYNWGAGMSDINNAAGFIKANMPLSRGNTLSDQDAWDVALFIDSQERPQDPRFAVDVTNTRKQFHDTENSMYGMTVNGKVLGSK